VAIDIGKTSTDMIAGLFKASIIVFFCKPTVGEEEDIRFH
jgi:hypothetical protein